MSHTIKWGKTKNMNIFKEIKRMTHMREHGVFTALSVVASPGSSGDAVNKSYKE